MRFRLGCRRRRLSAARRGRQLLCGLAAYGIRRSSGRLSARPSPDSSRPRRTAIIRRYSKSSRSIRFPIPRRRSMLQAPSQRKPLRTALVLERRTWVPVTTDGSSRLAPRVNIGAMRLRPMRAGADGVSADQLYAATGNEHRSAAGPLAYAIYNHAQYSKLSARLADRGRPFVLHVCCTSPAWKNAFTKAASILGGCCRRGVRRQLGLSGCYYWTQPPAALLHNGCVG